MELKGSKTEANLQAAFAGESMARNKYTYYASKAKKEGYNIIADKFEQTANNEKEHAKNLVQTAAQRGNSLDNRKPERRGGRRTLRVDRHVRHDGQGSRRRGL